MTIACCMFQSLVRSRPSAFQSNKVQCLNFGRREKLASTVKHNLVFKRGPLNSVSFFEACSRDLRRGAPHAKCGWPWPTLMNPPSTTTEPDRSGAKRRLHANRLLVDYCRGCAENECCAATTAQLNRARSRRAPEFIFNHYRHESRGRNRVPCCTTNYRSHFAATSARTCTDRGRRRRTDSAVLDKRVKRVRRTLATGQMPAEPLVRQRLRRRESTSLACLPIFKRHLCHR